MAVKKEKLRGKKKVWIDIVSPKLFSEKVIGQSLIEDSGMLVNRKISANLMQLTRNPVHQNVKVKFKIDSIKNNQAHCNIIGYTIIPTSLKRFVERNKCRVDFSFKVKTIDNIEIKLTPILITKSKINKPLQTVLRREATNALTKKVAAQKYETLVTELVSHKTQEFLKRSLKKTYPLKRAEIRVMKVLN